jgi:hypothetical protein
MAGRFTGTIRGTVNGDRTACFRLDQYPDLPTLWPKGYAARLNPLRVVNDHGKTVAVDGQVVELGGGIVDLRKTEIIRGCGEAKQVLAVG